jgi:hypothetical protein
VPRVIVLRCFGLAALVCLAAGATMVSENSALYAGQDVGIRPLMALLVPAACWIVALAFALTATLLSFSREGPPIDTLTLLLARGPGVLVFFAFAIRLFLFAAKD